MHEDFMREAIKMAVEAKQNGEFPFGAVVVKGGVVVSRGRPMDKETFDVTLHAESVAVSNACKTLHTRDLSDCAIYATGEPCAMCASAIFQAGIAKIYIGAVKEDLPNFSRMKKIRIFELSEDSNYEPHIETGLLKDQVIELFKDVTR